MYKRYQILCVASLLFLLLRLSPVSAVSYGSGVYGECEYGTQSSCSISDEVAPVSSTNPVTNADKDKSKPRITGDLLYQNPIYQRIGRIVLRIPKQGAYLFPYIVLLLILLLILRFIVQLRQELRRATNAIGTAERERVLTEEKNNFLFLLVHNLRTPIAVIGGNLELLQSVHSSNTNMTQQANQVIRMLSERVNNLLTSLERDSGISSITAQPIRPVVVRSATSAYFLLPVLLIALGTVFLNFIFIDFRLIQPSAVAILTQLLLGVLVVQLFFSTLRKRQINRQERINQEHILAEQRALDAARDQAIQEAAATIANPVEDLQQLLLKLNDGPELRQARLSLSQLASITNKFTIAIRLPDLKKYSYDPVNVAELLQKNFIQFQGKIIEKQLHLEVTGITRAPVVQNEKLLSEAVNALLDNAIKFSPAGEIIHIDVEQESDHVNVEIQNLGNAIDKQKLEQLFKPFSRADDVLHFNYQGLGFGLYLAKLIMRFMGGDVRLVSEADKGTIATLVIPAA